MIMSGGRLCYLNMSGLFIWLNPTGAADAEWQRISISAAHNEQWRGDPGFKFSDPFANSSYYSQTQDYTSLLWTGAREAVVTYNLYFNPQFGGGTDGCESWPPKPHDVDCSKGFAMRMTIEG